MKSQVEIQAEIEKFKKSLEGKTVEELRKLEEEIIKEAEVIDKEIAETNFELPKENYDIAAKAVRYFLNKKSVQWQYTMGMVAMYDFWTDEKPETIPYPQLDNILRTLGEMQFTGYEEWAQIVALNKYFEPLREEYITVTQKAYDVATKHNEIMNKLELNTPTKQG